MQRLSGWIHQVRQLGLGPSVQRHIAGVRLGTGHPCMSTLHNPWSHVTDCCLVRPGAGVDAAEMPQ